jgi:hypothetical protein
MPASEMYQDALDMLSFRICSRMRKAHGTVPDFQEVRNMAYYFFDVNYDAKERAKFDGGYGKLDESDILPIIPNIERLIAAHYDKILTARGSA